MKQRQSTNTKSTKRILSITLVALTGSLVSGLLLACPASAQDDVEPRVSVVNASLKHPFSVTIEKPSNRVIVAESGAMRIVAIEDGKPIELAADFPESDFRGYRVGPIAVAAAGESALLVCHANRQGKGALTRLLQTNQEAISEGKDKEPEYDRQTVEIENIEDRELGPLSHVMLKNSLAYVATNGDPTNGWVAIAGIQHKKLTTLSPLLPTTRHTGCESPTGIALSPNGAYLLVSQMGHRGDTADSRLVFYSISGKLLADYPVELNDVVAIAYSPNRNHLFAIDHHFSDPQQGGLYQIIASADEAGGSGTAKPAKRCELKKVADLSYATSMAFDDSGTLWVTTLGGPPSDEEGAPPEGTLLKIEGLDTPLEFDRPSTKPLEAVLQETQT